MLCILPRRGETLPQIHRVPAREVTPPPSRRFFKCPTQAFKTVHERTMCLSQLHSQYARTDSPTKTHCERLKQRKRDSAPCSPPSEGGGVCCPPCKIFTDPPHPPNLLIFLIQATGTTHPGKRYNGRCLGGRQGPLDVLEGSKAAPAVLRVCLLADEHRSIISDDGNQRGRAQRREMARGRKERKVGKRGRRRGLWATESRRQQTRKNTRIKTRTQLLTRRQYLLRERPATPRFSLSLPFKIQRVVAVKRRCCMRSQ